MHHHNRRYPFVTAVAVACATAASVHLTAQAGAAPVQAATTAASPGAATPTPTPNAPASTTPTTNAAPNANVPADYVIGADDLLSIVYWRDKDMSADVAVRPDGHISLPLLNDVQAAGLTPSQLRSNLVEASKKYFEDPSITVVVKQMNSRKVFITGEVAKPGPYPLTGPTTVLQLISIAGGLRDYAEGKKIIVVRNENGKQTTLPFNYKDVVSRKNLKQNIELQPGDTVIVP